MQVTKVLSNEKIINVIRLNGAQGAPGVSTRVTVTAGLTIPSTTSDVLVAVSDADFLQNGESVAGQLAQIPGILRRTGTSYYFTRSYPTTFSTSASAGSRFFAAAPSIAGKAGINSNATIPSSGGVVLAITPPDFLNDGGLVEGTLKGVTGILSRGVSGYTFTRSLTGSPVSVVSGVDEFFVTTTAESSTVTVAKNFTAGVNSSDVNTGTLVVSGNGGVGIGGTVNIGGKLFASGIDVLNFGSFTIGGSPSVFYPVRFYAGQKSPYSSSARIHIYRPSYVQNVNTAGGFSLKLNFSPTNNGNQPTSISNIDYAPFPSGDYSDAVGDIADGSTLNGGGNDLIVWLRGGLTYYWRSPEAGQSWTLLDGNSLGGNITDSSGSVRSPRTTQSQLIVDAKQNNQVIAGTKRYTDLTDSDSPITGSVIFSGGVAIGRNTNIAGKVSAAGVDIVNYGSFVVGGVATSFYPVRFQLFQKSPVPSSGRLHIFRSNFHDDIYGAGTFSLAFAFTPGSWGNQSSNISEIVYLPKSDGTYSDAVGDIKDGTTASNTGNDVIVWLRGGLSYYWRSPEAGQSWTLINGNSTGGSIADSSGNIHAPRTTQSDLILNIKSWRLITLESAFANLAGYSPLKTRVMDSRVEIRGTVSRSSLPSANTVIAFLPFFARPKDPLSIPQIAATETTATAIARIDLDSVDGKIIFQGLIPPASGSQLVLLSINTTFLTL